MRNLLSANFMRLWKSRSFWIAASVMAGIGIFEVVVSRWAADGAAMPLEMRYMIFPLLAGIVLSAFCALFVGTEYGDGTLRNKVAAGHSRTAVYLSQLAVCAAVGVLLCFAYILPFLAAGIPLLGFFQTAPAVVLRATLYALLMTAALAAVFTLISMLYANRAAAAVLSISLAYFLIFLGIFLNSRLSEPEMTAAVEYIQDGQILLREAAPNPAYVGGLKRAVYQFLSDLPGCQAVRLAHLTPEPQWELPLYSCAVLAASTGAGLALFRKKDIR